MRSVAINNTPQFILLFALVVFFKYCVNLAGLIKKMADCSVVVEGINNVSNVLTHIDLGIPLSLEKLGGSVNHIGGEYLVDKTVAVSLVKLFKTVTEKTKGSKYENTLCTLILKLLSNVDNGVARGNHIVNYDNVLAAYVYTSTSRTINFSKKHT